MPRDLTSTHGCAPLGLVVPAVRYELVRMDVDAWGQSLLYLGQPDTENRRGGPAERPTAYQPPLVRCRGLPPPVPALGALLDALEEEEEEVEDADSDADDIAASAAGPGAVSLNALAACLAVALARLRR